MGEAEPTKLQALESIMVKLKDLHNTYVAMVEKMARMQMEAQEKGLDFVADKLAKPFATASENVKLTEKVLHDCEIERNKIQNAD